MQLLKEEDRVMLKSTEINGHEEHILQWTFNDKDL
mgnify:CR=1 FL=1